MWFLWTGPLTQRFFHFENQLFYYGKTYKKKHAEPQLSLEADIWTAYYNEFYGPKNLLQRDFFESELREIIQNKDLPFRPYKRGISENDPNIFIYLQKFPEESF